MNLPIPNTQSYLAASPFPHLIIDGVMNKTPFEFMSMLWPVEHDHNQGLKYYTLSDSKMNGIQSYIQTHFQSQEFILFLEELTGVKGLVMDIRGGYALHETMVGGMLDPHLDYTIHNVTGLQHRVNAILYLNDVDGGGELELYEKTRAYGGYLTRKVSIAPKFNRMVIFNINTKAYHGHPGPVTGSQSRKSIALNYFSLPDKDAVKINTTFQRNIFKRIISKLKK